KYPGSQLLNLASHPVAVLHHDYIGFLPCEHRQRDKEHETEKDRSNLHDLSSLAVLFYCGLSRKQFGLIETGSQNIISSEEFHITAQHKRQLHELSNIPKVSQKKSV